MPAPYETTGMRGTLSGYAGWFIERRVAPAAPYFVAFVLCLGMMGAMVGEMQTGPEFVTYDLDRYGVSNHGDVLFRLDPVPNDDPIWVLVTDPVEYDFVMSRIHRMSDQLYMFIPDQRTFLPKPGTKAISVGPGPATYIDIPETARPVSGVDTDEDSVAD